MTPQERLYYELKNYLIEKHGCNFLRLSEKDQNNLILSVLQDYSNKLKNEK
jgi:hypothetical protein